MTAIGDKVFYYPAPTETGIPPDPDQPFLAFVCHVHPAPDAPAPATDAAAPAPNGKPPKDKPPQLVNLAVFDHRGMHHGRQDVPILADGKGVRPCCATAAYVKAKEKPAPAPTPSAPMFSTTAEPAPAATA